MKLLYLASQRFPTEKAYGIQIAKMCEAFANAGVDVELIAPTRKGELTNPFECYGVKRNFRFTRITSPDFYLPGILDRVAFYIKQFISAERLVRYARKNGADIFYTRDELVAFFLNLSCLQTVVFEAHNFSDRRRLFYRYFKKRGNEVVAINKKLGDEFRAFSFKPDNVLTAHDGFDNAEFANIPEKTKARQLLGLPEDAKIVMYAGHLFAWKGADILAKAAIILPNMLFVFVGGISSDIERFRNLYGVAGNILVVGYRPHADIPMYLSAADVLVLPNSSTERVSAQYTSPLKMFEYMASKRPIVASNLPSLREVLNDNNAVLVVPDDPTALAEGIKKILVDPTLAASINQQAYSDVENYSWSKRAEKILEFVSGK